MNDAVAVLPCTICDKPVSLETAKFDENGRAVHEQCYVQKLRRDAGAKSKDS